MRFTELSCYKDFLIPIETKKVSRFIEGINFGIKLSMATETEIGITI